MGNAGLNEAQAGINTAGRNIGNLKYADNTTLMAESKELKSLLMKAKEEMKGTLTHYIAPTVSVVMCLNKPQENCLETTEQRNWTISMTQGWNWLLLYW